MDTVEEEVEDTVVEEEDTAEEEEEGTAEVSLPSIPYWKLPLQS